MRSIVSAKPEFHYSIKSEHPVAKEFHNKYNHIDRILDENPSILFAVHDELCAIMNVFKGRNSQYSTETLFRMLLIKCIEQLSFRDLIVRVNDSTYLRNFARVGMGKLMGIALLDAVWKCISNETWDQINAMLLQYALDNKKLSGEKLRIDSTVCESNIHYPTDSLLLWDSYRVLAREMHQIQTNWQVLDFKYRFHTRKIKKLHTLISTRSGNEKESTKRMVQRSMKVLVERVEELYMKGKTIAAAACALHISEVQERLKELLQNVELVTIQSRRSQINGEKVSARDRIFSIFENHTELLKRGKARKPNEFGHLVTLAQTEEKFISYYSLDIISDHDTKQKDIALESHKSVFGAYPESFAADKNYYISMEDVAHWEEKIDTYSIGKKGKRNEIELEREHSYKFRDAQKFRAGCEGSISVLKRAFGLARCVYRTFKSFASSIGRLVFCHNLVLLTKT